MTIKKSKNIYIKTAAEVVLFLIGSFIFSLGIALFITPGKIAVGGFTGISIIINHLLSFPVGMTIIVLNIPMFLICAKVFGFKFILKTVVGVLLTSALIDILEIIPPFDISPELNALFGGILQGVGLGLVYSNGFTTGGTDLVLWLLKLKFPNLSSGSILFILDAVVVLVSAVLFKDPQSILFSVIAIFSYTKVLDTILGVGDRANLAFIITDEYEKIADSVTTILGRSVTVFDGKGWFSKRDKTILMCVIDRSQLYTMKKTVYDLDPAAFMILSDAREVIGLGFKENL